MRFRAHSAVTALFVAAGMMVLLLLLWGCGTRGPLSPELSSSGEDVVGQKILPADEGAWQTVCLQAYDPGGGIDGQPEPSGQLRYLVAQELFFQGEVHLQDLLPNREYLLAVVGKPGLPGRSEEYVEAGVIFYDQDAPYPYTGQPTQPGGTRGEQEYCDFAMVVADQDGLVDRSFLAELPAGTYDVELQVKDAHIWCHYAETGDFETQVLHNDQVSFRILSQIQSQDQ